MKFIADLQIHSKYSRATSPQMLIEKLSEWAKIKGIKVLGTGDFTHPDWLKELEEKLEPREPGLFVWKDDKSKEPTRFMLTAETSHIYSKKGKTRRVHLVIWAPSFDAVKKINTQLGWTGNLKSDGRPIIGMDCKELLKIVLNSDPSCMVIPAHIWTPWFSVFGSMSGFNSLEECFEELTPNIYAVETGLSSDPAMNWRLSQLDKVAIVSNSDSHSLERLGREANIFDTELSYNGIIEAVKNSIPHLPAVASAKAGSSAFSMTIEFYPEEGKYHYDGHRICNVCFSSKETKEHKGICPKCGKPVTVGVAARVEELADRPEGFKPENRVSFKNLVPLDEIIAEAFGTTSKTKKVYEEYHKLCEYFNGELLLLLEGKLAEISSVSNARIAEAVRRVREGELKIEPGYDGEYGKIKIFEQGEVIEEKRGQTSLF